MFDLAFSGFLALGFARCGDLQSDSFGILVFIFVFFLFMLCLFMLVLLLLRLFVVVTSDCLA